jgi:hypothetical protein
MEDLKFEFRARREPGFNHPIDLRKISLKKHLHASFLSLKYVFRGLKACM